MSTYGYIIPLEQKTIPFPNYFLSDERYKSYTRFYEDYTTEISPEPHVESPCIGELTRWSPLEAEVDGRNIVWFRGDSLADIFEGMPISGWPRPRRDPMAVIKELMLTLKMMQMAREALLNGPMIGRDDKMDGGMMGGGISDILKGRVEF